MADVGFTPVRGNKNEIENTPLEDGQFLFTTESGTNNKIYVDVLRDNGTIERVTIAGEYVSTSGGDIDGNLNINGDLDISGDVKFVSSVGQEISLKNIFKAIYPVGSIYMSTSPINPSTFFGGSWTQWGKGRVPIGVDTNDSDFNASEKTGGSKTITYKPQGTIGGTALNSSQIPPHNHAMFVDMNGDSEVYGISASNKYAFKSNEIYDPQDPNPSMNSYKIMGTTTPPTVGITSTVGSGSTHTHTFDGTTSTQNNLSPYITCYMWKRVL